QLCAVGEFLEQRWRLRKILPVFAGRDFVQDFAQTVEVRLRGARTFRRNETFRAHVRPGFANIRYQTDVRQLRHAIDENDVRRLDVAVNQPALVQMPQRGRQRLTQLQTFFEGEAAAVNQVVAKGARAVISNQWVSDR